MLNRVVLIGRTCAEPELRYTGSGVAVANFTLAVDRPFKNQQGEKETDFIRCTVWKKQAETVAEYIGKGQLIAVDGRVQVDKYEDKEGNKRESVGVIADSVRFLERKKDGQSARQSEDSFPGDDSSELPF